MASEGPKIDGVETGEAGLRSEAPARQSSSYAKVAPAINWCAVVSLLWIIATSAASLSAKDEGWFGQDAYIAANLGNLFLGIGTYKFRFGWQGGSFDYEPESNVGPAAQSVEFDYSDIGDVKYAVRRSLEATLCQLATFWGLSLVDMDY